MKNLSSKLNEEEPKILNNRRINSRMKYQLTLLFGLGKNTFLARKSLLFVILGQWLVLKGIKM